MYRLKDEYLQIVIADEMLQAKIALATQRRISSVQRWAQMNSDRLTMEVVLHTIKSHLNITEGIKLTTCEKLETV